MGSWLKEARDRHLLKTRQSQSPYRIPSFRRAIGVKGGIQGSGQSAFPGLKGKHKGSVLEYLVGRERWFSPQNQHDASICWSLPRGIGWNIWFWCLLWKGAMILEDLNGWKPGAIPRFPSHLSHAWRITPVSKWLITMVDNKSSPLTGVVPLLNGLSMSYKWGLLSTY